MKIALCEVRGEFLGFIEAESRKRVALAERFMTTKAEFGIETRKVRAQALRRYAKCGVQADHKSACIRSSVRPFQSTLS